MPQTSPLLYTARARQRAAAPALARIARWVRLKLDGRGRSPAAAWLSDLLDRLGDARRRAERWVEVGA